MEISGQLGKWEFSVLMDEIFSLCIPWSDLHSVLRKRCKSKSKTAQYHPSFLLFCQPQLNQEHSSYSQS